MLFYLLYADVKALILGSAQRMFGEAMHVKNAGYCHALSVGLHDASRIKFPSWFPIVTLSDLAQTFKVTRTT